ncbi:MAG: rod shape-determining protein MreD [Bacteroidia bacterium]
MLIDIFKILLRFIVLVLVQVTLLNNIQLSGLVNPYLYVMFILVLPFNMPKMVVMVFAMITGVVVGVFTNTAGLHAAACITLAFVRPGVLKLLSPREGYEAETSPTIRDMGFRWFIIYSAILVFIHHLVLFFLEVFRFNEVAVTFTRVIFSSFFTLLLIVISQYLFSKTRAER